MCSCHTLPPSVHKRVRPERQVARFARSRGPSTSRSRPRVCGCVMSRSLRSPRSSSSKFRTRLPPAPDAARAARRCFRSARSTGPARDGSGTAAPASGQRSGEPGSPRVGAPSGDRAVRGRVRELPSSEDGSPRPMATVAPRSPSLAVEGAGTQRQARLVDPGGVGLHRLRDRRPLRPRLRSRGSEDQQCDEAGRFGGRSSALADRDRQLRGPLRELPPPQDEAKAAHARERVPPTRVELVLQG